MVLTEQQRREIGALALSAPCILQLARKYKCRPGTINRWLAEGRKMQPNYGVAPGRGRKPVLSPAERTAARRMAANNKTARAITLHLNRKREHPVSETTVLRAIRSARCGFVWRAVTARRRLSDANKAARVQFSRSNQQADVSNWVFLDAKYLYCYNKDGNRRRFCWQRLDKKPKSARTGAATVFLFYGAVALGHKSELYFVHPTPEPGSKKKKSGKQFTSSDYIAMLRGLKREIDQWFPDGGYLLIRDHAPQHMSADSEAAVAEMGLHVHDAFPAQSWDLNIIENVWGVLDNNMQDSRARTNDGWRRGIKHAWKCIKQSTIDALVGSVNRRMGEVIEMEGAWLE
jgi:DDE superfamily endonuclease